MGHGIGLGGHERLDLGDAQVLPGQQEAGFHRDDLLEHVQSVAGVATFKGGHGLFKQVTGFPGQLFQRDFFHDALLARATGTIRKWPIPSGVE